MEDNKVKEIEKEEKDEFVTLDGAGRYRTPLQEIFIDDKGTIKEVIFEIVKPQNLAMYNKAYWDFAANKNVYEFAQKILPKAINKPAEARKVEFFDFDPEALTELVTLIIEIMGKYQENKKRKLNMTLR
jgi:hypothetical protein|nr:MAG TPA: hypothetical protein [Caudoviricetes sp.]